MGMKVLVVGKGGREHALVRALNQSESVQEVLALPGSDGMAAEAKIFTDKKVDLSNVLEVVHSEKIDLVVIGPEAPLADGLADQLRESDVLVFGPGKLGAELEASKIAAKKFMQEAGVPTSSAVMVTNVEETLGSAKSFQAPFVLKADGLAAGKGVFICKDETELEAVAKDLFENKVLGEAGEQALLEEFHTGYELSVLILTNGRKYEVLPIAQDHKRIFDNDEGPNTGGMGTVAPMELSKTVMMEISEKVLQPTVKHLKNRGLDYRGVIFIGIMMTDEGPITLEYNVRFGDPETQVIMPLLDGDWGHVLKTIASGEIPEMNWKEGATACVVLAAEGYPDTSKKGVEISGPCDRALASQYFLHAGTQKIDGKWVTDGGRVLNSIGIGENYKVAVENAYQGVNSISWPGMQYRKDIGTKLAENVEESSPNERTPDHSDE